jgi:adenine phosphoribosyltransferase
MVKQIENSDHVILVWTKKYKHRFDGKEKGGSEIEGKLITQEYLGEGKREKYIPVVFSSRDVKFVPTMFRDMTIYNLSQAEHFIELYSRLTRQPLVQKPKVGKIMPKNQLLKFISATEIEFPLLESVIDKTPTITVRGIDGQRYAFHLFPFGERGSKLSQSLREEIIKGLVRLVHEVGQEFDYVVGIKEGGFAWAEHVARELNRETNSFYEKETERGEKYKEELIEGEMSLHLKTILYEKDLYFRDFKAGDRVIIIDDVVSSGQTMQTIIVKLKEIGVRVVGAFCIVAKTDGYKIVEREGVPLRWLQYVRGLA